MIEVPNTLDLPPQGKSSRGAYLANQWYGHQAALLRYMGLPTDEPIHAKMQIGWQPNTGLDGEQGMKLEVRKQRLPHLLWGNRHKVAMASQGITWGHAIGAPFLYGAARAVEALMSHLLLGSRRVRPIAFPCHSVEGYSILSGWREFAVDLVEWSRAQGWDGATVCLHPTDYARTELRVALEAVEGVSLFCCGGIFDTGYLGAWLRAVAAHDAVVVDSATSAMFYAAWVGKPVFCRGNPLRTSPHHPDDAQEKDHTWIASEFPWAMNGATGAPIVDAAGRELGADCLKSVAQLREILYGDSTQVADWRGETGTSYTINKLPSDDRINDRALTISGILGDRLGEISSVFEVGCGGGANLAAFARLCPGVKLFGADVNDTARLGAESIAACETFDCALPALIQLDDIADLTLAAGVLIHVDPQMWRAAAAELVRMSKRYVLLLEYYAAEPQWNGWLGSGDFGKVLEDVGCMIIAKGEQETSELARHWWLADVGDKVVA